MLWGTAMATVSIVTSLWKDFGPPRKNKLLRQHSNDYPLSNKSSEMSWTDSDHARLVQLKVQRANLLRVPDEEKDKEKIRKLTIEIKQIKRRLIALEKGGSVQNDAEPIAETILPSETDEDSEEAKSEGVEGKDTSSSEPKTLERLSWPQFRTKHKGTPKEEISKLWAEYKESLN